MNGIVDGWISGIVALVVSVFTVWFLNRKSRKNAAKIASIELRLSEAVPISVAFRETLIKKLTHAHTPELDDLLMRIDHLNEEETQRFDELLRERVIDRDDPEIDDEERDAAVMLPMMNKRVRSEALIRDTGVQVVLIPPEKIIIKEEKDHG
jgi:hypothetical protein